MIQFRAAYFVNQCPMASHNFIQREILALEQQGLELLRMVFRGRTRKSDICGKSSI